MTITHVAITPKTPCACITITTPDGAVRYEIYPHVLNGRCLIDVFEVHVNTNPTANAAQLAELTNWSTTVALENLPILAED